MITLEQSSKNRAIYRTDTDPKGDWHKILWT